MMTLALPKMLLSGLYVLVVDMVVVNMEVAKKEVVTTSVVVDVAPAVVAAARLQMVTIVLANLDLLRPGMRHFAKLKARSNVPASIAVETPVPLPTLLVGVGTLRQQDMA